MIKKILIFIKNKIQIRACRHILLQLEPILAEYQSDIPVFIVGYNNGEFIRNSVDQLNAFNIKPIIFNNASTDNETLNILKEIQLSGNGWVVNSSRNFGHLIGFLDPIYKKLPEIFAYTDPDLQFNKNLPPHFLEILANLCSDYKTFKAGFSLDLLPDEEIVKYTQNILKYKPFSYKNNFEVRDWEKKFWRFKLENSNYDIYAADIDTTFAVYKKSNFSGNFFDAIRIGGDFKAIHLPWFPNINLMTDNQTKKYLSKNKSTTWVRH